MFARRVRPTAAAAILLITALPCAAQLRPQQLPKPIPAKPAGTTLPAPDDLAAPPESSTRTASGLAWRMLGAPAAAAERPGPNDKVETRYTGWTTDGRMFDTTEVSGTTREFRVTGVIPGFEEAVQLLSIGEKGRFWIPEALAYPGRPGKPQGMLVFDLELIGITRGPQPIVPVAAPPEDAQQSESGLAWVVLEEGNLAAEPPGPADTVLVEYSSWTPDGRLIDTTAFAGDPEAFTLDLTIAGFRETFATMLPGERRQVWIPSELTELDGQHVHAGTVVFDLKLLSYLKPPQTPASVAAIPPDAQRSVTGLAWQVLVPGTGDRHPARGQTVEALYAGWTTDGALFDSTHSYGRAARFVLDDSMPLGWNEALFGMVTGETSRVWIPEDLAYMGRKDRPRGMLVFEIELVAIHSPEVDASGRTP
jgi:peptidylprolyl isomerase